MAKKPKSSLTGTGTITNTNNTLGAITTGTSNVANWANSTVAIGNNVNAIYGNGHGSWGSATIQQPKTTFVILGEELEVEGYIDMLTPLVIASLNVLGKPYWLELKKQNIHIDSKIEAFIEERITILDRDKKIDDILK